MSEGLILAAEDVPFDAQLLELAFKRAKIPARLIIVSDGQEAIDYLSGGGSYSDRAAHPLPDLILLDLKMPVMSGFDVLAWLQSHEQFNKIPALVLTSSSVDRDVQKTKELGAREYHVKPLMLDELMEIVLSIHARWIVGGNANSPSSS